MSDRKYSLELIEFFKCYSKKSDYGRYFTKSQIFIAFRSYMSRTNSDKVVLLDFATFSKEFDEEVTQFQFNTFVIDDTKYYQLFLKPLDTDDVHKESNVGSSCDFLLARKEPLSKTSTNTKGNVKVPLNELNIFLCCKLCCGYLVDATTITECLHSFCKSCIVMHFQINPSCPVCGTVVTTANPFSSLKSDAALQDIVSRLLPGTVTSEEERFNKFEMQMLDNKNKALSTYIRLPRRCNFISICLEWVGKENCTLDSEDLVHKFIRVSDQATVAHIAQFILQKLGKTDKKTKPLFICEVRSGGVVLPYVFTLEDIIKNKFDFEAKKGMPLLKFDIKPL